MCRLLYAHASTPFPVLPILTSFAAMARESPEYQGHGWGIAIWGKGRWMLTHSLTPIWEDDLSRFGSAERLIVHARSAFRDEGIAVENNMPFAQKEVAFAFNGELHGVRIHEEGRIGAEKIFNLLLKRHSGEWHRTISEGSRVIRSRSKRIRALNFVIATDSEAWCYSEFDERPDYFTLYLHRQDASNDGMLVLSSMPLAGITPWEPLPQGHPIALR